MGMKKILIFHFCILLNCTTSKNLDTYKSDLYQFRENYKKDFLENSRSPLTAEDLPFLDFYSGNKEWVLPCTCVLAENAIPFEMPTYSGVTRTYILYSVANCKRKNKTLTLHLYKNIHPPINPMYKNNLFLPVKDLTNGEETYGGGRYINLLDTEIKNGKIVIDFNRCYNPWCAYSDGYNCPIPPRENHLNMEVEAGEKNFKGEHKYK